MSFRLPALGAWLSRGENLLFAALLVLCLVPLWTCKYFPSQDGPNHLYSAGVLRHLAARPVPGLSTDSAGDLYRRFYTINPKPIPNWLSHATLAGLMALAPPRIAEKILLTLYILLLPLGMRAALRATSPGAEPLAVLVMPFIYNLWLHMGFYNFVFGLAAALFTLSFWLRHQERPRPRHAAGLFLFFVLLYFCHLVVLAMTLLALAMLAAWLPVCDWLEGRRTPDWDAAAFRRRQRRLTLGRAAFTLGALAPVLVLAALFLGHSSVSPQAPGALTLNFDLKKFGHLFSLDTTLFTFRLGELSLGRLLTGGLLLLALGVLGVRVRRRQVCRGDGWLLVGLAWLAAYLAAPASIGAGTYLYHRLAIFVFLALILWLGAGELPRAARLAAQTLGASMTLILLLFYTQRYAEDQNLMAEYLSAAAAIPRGAVILPVCLSPRGLLPDGHAGAAQTQPFIHASGLVALERGGVDLSDYEGGTDHFPTRLRPELSFAAHQNAREDDPTLAWLDPARYERESGVRIDAVLVWQDARRRLEDPPAAPLRARIEQEFRLVYVSKPQGLMKVYQRK